MALKRYHTTVRAGRTDVDTIMKLPEEQGKELGLKEYKKSGAKAADAPQNKAAKPAANKAAKPAENKSESKKADDDATDPGASE